MPRNEESGAYSVHKSDSDIHMVDVCVHLQMDAEFQFQWKSVSFGTETNFHFNWNLASYFTRPSTCTMWMSSSKSKRMPTFTWPEIRHPILIGCRLPLQLKVGARLKSGTYFPFIGKSAADFILEANLQKNVILASNLIWTPTSQIFRIWKSASKLNWTPTSIQCM